MYLFGQVDAYHRLIPDHQFQPLLSVHFFDGGEGTIPFPQCQLRDATGHMVTYCGVISSAVCVGSNSVVVVMVAKLAASATCLHAAAVALGNRLLMTCTSAGMMFAELRRRSRVLYFNRFTVELHSDANFLPQVASYFVEDRLTSSPTSNNNTGSNFLIGCVVDAVVRLHALNIGAGRLFVAVINGLLLQRFCVGNAACQT